MRRRVRSAVLGPWRDPGGGLARRLADYEAWRAELDAHFVAHPASGPVIWDLQRDANGRAPNHTFNRGAI